MLSKLYYNDNKVLISGHFPEINTTFIVFLSFIVISKTLHSSQTQNKIYLVIN